MGHVYSEYKQLDCWLAKDLQGLTNQKKIHLPTGQVNFFFTCPAQIPTCPGFVRLKFLYAQDLQTEIEVPLLTLR